MSNQKLSSLPDGGAPQAGDKIYVARAGEQVRMDLSEVGGSMTPPVTLTGTDGSQYILKLVFPADQSVLAFEIRDSDGNLLADFDELGKFDVQSFNVQVPPDIGSGGKAVSVQPDLIEVTKGWVRITDDDGANEPFTVRDGSSGNAAIFRVRSPESGDLIDISPTTDQVAVQILAPPSPTKNVLEVWDNDFNNMLFAISKNGGVIFSPSDPHVAGAWWDNAGTLTRSTG